MPQHLERLDLSHGRNNILFTEELCPRLLQGFPGHQPDQRWRNSKDSNAWEDTQMMQNDAMYTCDMYIYILYIYIVYIFELLCTHLSRKPKQCISCTMYSKLCALQNSAFARSGRLPWQLERREINQLMSQA